MHAVAMGDSGMWRLGRRPALDGLRGVAIALVLVSHVVAYEASGHFEALGSAGVEVFFALSGFLITALLLEAHAAGRWSLRRFYGRRARRLLPALALVLVVTVALSAVMATPLVSNPWPTVFYVANWASLDQDLGALSPTWSLAVEEQFYFVWPLLLLVMLRWRRGPLLLACALIAASTTLRFILTDGHRVYVGSDTQAASLMAGALLAVLAHQGLPAWRLPAWVTGLGAAGLFSCAALGSWGSDRFVPTVVPVVTAALIWAACSSPGGPLEWSWLRYVGRRSYAIYLWHTPLLWMTTLAAHKGLVQGAAAVAITFMVAEVSWRLVEEPFLRGRVRPVVIDDVAKRLRV